jgi:hypothetical protein
MMAFDEVFAQRPVECRKIESASGASQLPMSLLGPKLGPFDKVPAALPAAMKTEENPSFWKGFFFG